MAGSPSIAGISGRKRSCQCCGCSGSCADARDVGSFRIDAAKKKGETRHATERSGLEGMELRAVRCSEVRHKTRPGLNAAKQRDEVDDGELGSAPGDGGE